MEKKVYYKMILLKDEDKLAEANVFNIIQKKITIIRDGLNEMIETISQKTAFK